MWAGGDAEFVSSPLGLAINVASLLATLASVVLLQRLGGPSFASMGLRREAGWQHDLAGGLALGPIVFGGVMALELALGWARVSPGRLDAVGLLLSLLSYTAVAFNEEILARGFLFQVAGRAWGLGAAFGVSSAVFGLLHTLNPNASPVAVVAIMVAGLLFAWAYVASGRLWLPIGLHWSWNVAQGPLFGFPVSGMAADGLLAATVSGPAWATGGAFGPEAGLVGLLAMGAVAGLIGWWRGVSRL